MADPNLKLFATPLIAQDDFNSILFLLSIFMDSIKLICWKCRGVSGSDTTSQIKQMMRKSKPHIICLVETRANENRLNRFVSTIDHKWGWAAIEANGYSGGIIAIWQRQIGLVTPVARSRYALHLVISAGSHSDWVLSIIFNSS